MTDQRQQIERVLDLAVYAPVGLALTLCDHLPRAVHHRRQRLLNRVQLARFIGELAVRHSKAEIDKELQARRAADAATTDTATVAEQPAPAGGAVAPPSAESHAESPVESHVVVPLASELPLGDYESLAAIHVVERLGSLRDDEVELIRRFEAAHRARRTVLAKIAQIQDLRSA